MKRLLRVSLDILITSIVPIISWFLLGIILDRHLINIFSLTYLLQCLMGMIISIFGVGANISIYKDRNKDLFFAIRRFSIQNDIKYDNCLFNKNDYIIFANTILYNYI